MKARIATLSVVSSLAVVAVVTANAVSATASPTRLPPSASTQQAPLAMAATDTDGDSLPDSWEVNGYDANGDGTIDVDLPAMGATPNKKDLFVEMDYMSGRLASTAALDRIVQVFATAPVSNPDGTTGIRIHLDAGSARGTAYNLGGGNQVPYDSNLQPALQQTNAIKAGNFATARKPIFHYMLWADSYSNGCSSGNAFAIPNDTFIVTMGPKCGWNVTEDMNVGTFIHEFGHNLGLRHGGTDHVNYKPNYLSVMNYFFQFNGVPKATGGGYFGFSNFAPPSLTESSLREPNGLGTSQASAWLTKWKCPNGTTRTSGPANQAIDWNCDGDAVDTTSADVNDDNNTTTLTTQNNWANIVFGGGNVGGAGNANGKIAATTTTEDLRELTRDEFVRLQKNHR